jgi:hypothetical protein
VQGDARSKVPRPGHEAALPRREHELKGVPDRWQLYRCGQLQSCVNVHMHGRAGPHLGGSGLSPGGVAFLLPFELGLHTGRTSSDPLDIPERLAGHKHQWGVDGTRVNRRDFDPVPVSQSVQRRSSSRVSERYGDWLTSYSLSRRITPATVAECHLPPRAVGVPKRFSSSAISWVDIGVRPEDSFMIRRTVFASTFPVLRRAISGAN